MSIFTKMGVDAVNSAATNEGGADSPIVSFKSGTTFKVGVKSITNVAEYYGYGIYKKVNTFVPKNPAQRNAKGFITGNPTVWDRAADYLYVQAKAAKEAGASDSAVKEITDQAYLYKGKPRFLRAFFDLTTGKDIVVDLSPNQEKVIKAAIEENAEDLDALAFKLTKKGEGTGAVVSLSVIVKMERDLTPEERANFGKLADAPFDMESFESCLYLADETEQIKNLVVAGFDIGILGLTLGAGANANTTGTTPDAPEPTGAPIGISDDDLPQF